MGKKHGPRVIEVSGSDRSIGHILGKSCRLIAHQNLKESRVRLRALGIEWERNVRNSLRFLPFAEDYSPRYMELMRGYAEGSGLGFEDIFAMLYEGETFGCTDIAVNQEATSDGSVLSAHTEDWWTTYQQKTVLVGTKPKNGPSILATTFGGLEFIGGINSAGLSVTVNSLTQNDMRVGVPRVMLAFEALSSRSIGDAINACTPEDRASGNNFSLCHKSGEMYCVELSATDHSLLYPSNGCLLHTNHYLHPRMERYESIFDSKAEPNRGYSTGSVIRYNRASRLLRDSIGDVDRGVLSSIQKDHINRPHSICCHVERNSPKPLQWKTIFSVVYDLGRRSMWIGIGNPCETQHEEYQMS